MGPYGIGSRLHARNVLADVITKALPTQGTVVNLDAQQSLATMAGAVARRQAARMIVGLTDNRKRAVSELVAMALEQDWPDSLLQQRVQETVGLDPRRVRAVENYRKSLVAAGRPRGTANRMAREYSKRLRDERAYLIADTEGRNAVAEAQRVLWQAMRKDGSISPYAVRVTQGQNDVRKCPTCRKENGRRRSLKNKDGGPPFHPRCRCYEVLEDRGIMKMDLTVRSWDEVGHLPASA